MLIINTQGEAEQLFTAPENEKAIIQCDLDLSQYHSELIKPILFMVGQLSSGRSINLGTTVLNRGIHFRPEWIQAPEALSASELQSFRVQDVEVTGGRSLNGVTFFGFESKRHQKAANSDAYFTKSAQAYSPYKITVNDMVFDLNLSDDHCLAYMGCGTNACTISECIGRGSVEKIGIYVDCESIDNQILDNQFDIKTGREFIAMDGCAHTQFEGNELSDRTLDYGAVRIYRNSGEAYPESMIGTVRHQEPTHNVICDNEFNYERRFQWAPTIWVGSREGKAGYSDMDQQFEFGSAVCDLDKVSETIIDGNSYGKKLLWNLRTLPPVAGLYQSIKKGRWSDFRKSFRRGLA